MTFIEIYLTFIEICSCFMYGLIFAYATFAITKKLFHKRVISYISSGLISTVSYIFKFFDEDISKILLIISMIIAILITFALVIGEKRALSSGKHSGNFEEDRGARKYSLVSIKKVLKKFPYPFLKEKGILNNLEFKPANEFVNENSSEYIQEVAAAKITGHLLHWIGIYCWYVIVFGIWFWYFIGYSLYWMIVALVDTFIDLYTKKATNSETEIIENFTEENNSANNFNSHEDINNPTSEKVNNKSMTCLKINPVLIGIIILLCIIMGLLIFMTFSQNKNNKEQNNNVMVKNEFNELSEKIIENTTEIISTSEQKINISEVTTNVTITNNTQEKIELPKAISSYKDSYKKIISDEINHFKDSVDNNFSIKYTLFDMDYDGTPEFLINSGTCEADSIISIYTYKNNKCSQICNNISGSDTIFAFDYIANQIVLCKAHMGTIKLSWYDIDENGNLRFLIDTSSSGNDYDGYATFMSSYNVLKYPYVYYYNNSTSIYYTMDNYNSDFDSEYPDVDFSFIDNYDSLKSKVDNVIENAVPATESYIPPKETYGFSGIVNTESSDLNVRSKPLLDSSVIGTLPKGTSVSVYYIDGYSDWYKVYCSNYDLSGYVSSKYIISDDFYSQKNNYSTGQVATENDPLNLRDTPSSSGNIIVKMPKGAYVDIIDTYGDWYYLSYIENGTTYYGYASCQYIK